MIYLLSVKQLAQPVERDPRNLGYFVHVHIVELVCNFSGDVLHI